jgi:hypothetical protein
LGVFIGFRLLQALGSPRSYDDGDGFTACAAWEMLHNDVWPHSAYQLSDWEHGSRLAVLLALPLTWLLGPSVLALKLTGLLFSTVTLLGLWLSTREIFGRPAANVAGLLYLMAPTPVFEYSLTALGSYPDSLAIQLLFLWGLATAFRRGAGPGQLALVGLLGGFAVWFAAVSAALVLPASLALLWVIWRGPPGGRPARRRVRLTLAYGAGLALFGGIWLVYFLGHGPGGQAREPLLVVSHGPRPDLLPAAAYRVIFWVLAALALSWPLVRRLRRQRAAPGERGLLSSLDWVLPGAWLLLLLWLPGSSPPVHPSRLVPLVVLPMIPLAGLLAGLLRRDRPGWRMAGVVGVALLSLPGLARNLGQINLDAMGIARHVDGRNYPLFFQRAWQVTRREGPAQMPGPRALWGELPLELLHLERIQAGLQASNFAGLLAEHFALSQQDHADRLQRTINEGELPGSQSRKLILAGVALAASENRVLHALNDPGPVLELFPGVDGSFLLEGIGFGLAPSRWHTVLGAAARSAPDPIVRRRWLTSLARGMGRSVTPLVLHSRQDLRCAGSLPPEIRGNFFRGLGWGMSCRLLSGDPDPVARWICPRWRRSFVAGFESSGDRCRRVFRPNRLVRH